MSKEPKDFQYTPSKITQNVTEGVKDRLDPGTIFGEMKAELNRLAVLGSYEMGGLWTANAYRGDLALLTSGAAPVPASDHGVHGPATDNTQASTQPTEPTAPASPERHTIMADKVVAG